MNKLGIWDPAAHIKAVHGVEMFIWYSFIGCRLKIAYIL
jgi:hypothetical protein